MTLEDKTERRPGLSQGATFQVSVPSGETWYIDELRITKNGDGDPSNNISASAGVFNSSNVGGSGEDGAPSSSITANGNSTAGVRLRQSIDGYASDNELILASADSTATGTLDITVVMRRVL